MQINQLPNIPQAPADADVMAIEVNGVTYKVSKQTLASAIAANITPADIGAKATQSAVSDPTASGTAVTFIDSLSQNAQGVIAPTKKTVRSASQSAAGLMSAADKTKLDGINLDYTIYNSVTDLGLTSGSATLTAAFNALGTYSILICSGGEFATTELPFSTAGGVVEIVIASSRARAYIHFYGKTTSDVDWRMYVNSGNVPTGTWVCVTPRRMTINFTYTASAAMTRGERVYYTRTALPSGVTADMVKAMFFSDMSGANNFIATLTINSGDVYVNLYAATTSSTASCSGTATIIY